ncbi:retrovirus-related pol polyprotein from transposon RE2 [Citrus sinensis]|uniref:Retrovirus-related pol polyprotein from transposon RE2 n=1 Tax=Citrus sinensis TaxID=2711 RepID=A0ACB8M171_CITSI|nr:retrovirus-related pol polyprotein from transposon RE2 [Citrus sinensis]
MNVEEYCAKMKLLANKLACVGDVITEKDLLMRVLNGLGSGYLDLASIITTNKMSYDDAYALLLTHEARLEQNQSAKTVFNANYSTMNVNHPYMRGNFRKGVVGNGNYGRYVNRGFNVGRGIFHNPYPRGFSPGVGHAADECWHRYDNNPQPSPRHFGRGRSFGSKAAYTTNFDPFINYAAPSTEEQYVAPYSSYNLLSYSLYPSTDIVIPEAYLTNYEGPVGEGWYLDSDATHHLTNNMANMNVREEFRGSDQLVIGNGQGLPITHIVQPNTHPMTTRSKAGIFKLKLYTATLVHKEPDSVYEAMQNPKWFTTMKKEYAALIQSGTWSLVPKTNDQRVIGNKWVYRVKYNTDGSVAKYKARLVAKGFQQIIGVNCFETFSPVIKPVTVIVVLSLAVMNQWKIRQVDVNNAFLNGDLTEEVFMDQPEGFISTEKPDFVCKLHKSLYGLKQAPRACFELENFITEFSTKFALKDLGVLSYFLGIEVMYDTYCIFLSQKKYIRDLLSRVEMINCKDIDTPMSTGMKLQKEAQGNLGHYVEDVTHYRSIVGGMQYLVLTRPEIAFSVHKLSQYVSAPTLQHLMACKRVLRYLKATQDYGLKFIKDGDMKLIGFTDADWAGDLDDRKSVGAYCIYLGHNMISWSSKKQPVIARSSAESEYRSLASASAEISWLQSLFSELRLQCIKKPIIWCDNLSATELAHNLVLDSRTKHIEIDIHYVINKVLAGELNIQYIPNEEQVADIMTKPLSFIHFNYLRAKLNVMPCPLSLRGAVKAAHYSSSLVKPRQQKVVSDE